MRNQIVCGKLLASGLLLLLPITASQAEGGRFVMEKTEQGYVRMDTETGAMSICDVKDDQIICKMAADERAAFNQDIKVLEDRVAALETQMINRAPLRLQDNELPTEEEFERGLGYMEQFMRRFMGVVKELDEPANRT